MRNDAAHFVEGSAQSRPRCASRAWKSTLVGHFGNVSTPQLIDVDNKNNDCYDRTHDSLGG
ncbi:hypothetical protein D3C72_2230480 [compost metagenome]